MRLILRTLRMFLMNTFLPRAQHTRVVEPALERTRQTFWYATRPLEHLLTTLPAIFEILQVYFAAFLARLIALRALRICLRARLAFFLATRFARRTALLCFLAILRFARRIFLAVRFAALLALRTVRRLRTTTRLTTRRLRIAALRAARRLRITALRLKIARRRITALRLKAARLRLKALNFANLRLRLATRLARLAFFFATRMQRLVHLLRCLLVLRLLQALLQDLRLKRAANLRLRFASAGAATKASATNTITNTR